MRKFDSCRGHLPATPTDYERELTAIVVLDRKTRVETELDRYDLDFVMEPAWQPVGT